LSSDHTIKEYFLGGLTEEEQQQFEERLFADRSFFEQVKIVEDELIDTYIAGNLPENKRFVTNFLATPQQIQKLRIAMALKKKVSELETGHVPDAANHSRIHASRLSRLFYAMRTRAVPTGLKLNS
jgi:anti-sigma-K factor RskA